MMHPVRRHRLALAVLALIFLSGCGGVQLLPPPMTPQLYVLRPQAGAPMGAPVTWRLSVAEPEALASLDTTRIALTRSPTTMDYFANAAWNDRVPLIVQRLLIQTFDSGGRIVAVGRETAGLENDYLLQTDIREFAARYDSPEGAPEIVVSIQAKLARTQTREIAGSLNSTKTVRASANDLDSIVIAFNKAAGDAIADIAAWTLNAAPP